MRGNRTRGSSEGGSQGRDFAVEGVSQEGGLAHLAHLAGRGSSQGRDFAGGGVSQGKDFAGGRVSQGEGFRMGGTVAGVG